MATFSVNQMPIIECEGDAPADARVSTSSGEKEPLLQDTSDRKMT